MYVRANAQFIHQRNCDFKLLLRILLLIVFQSIYLSILAVLFLFSFYSLFAISVSVSIRLMSFAFDSTIRNFIH